MFWSPLLSHRKVTFRMERNGDQKYKKNKAPVTSPQVVVLRSLESGFHMIVANLKLLNQAFL